MRKSFTCSLWNPLQRARLFTLRMCYKCTFRPSLSRFEAAICACCVLNFMHAACLTRLVVLISTVCLFFSVRCPSFALGRFGVHCHKERVSPVRDMRRWAQVVISVTFISFILCTAPTHKCLLPAYMSFPCLFYYRGLYELRTI